MKKETKKWWKKSQWNWGSQTIVPYRRFTKCSNLYFFTFTRKGKSAQKEWFGNNSGMLSTPRPYRFINTPMIMYMRTNGKKLKRDISRNFRNYIRNLQPTNNTQTNKQKRGIGNFRNEDNSSLQRSFIIYHYTVLLRTNKITSS